MKKTSLLLAALVLAAAAKSPAQTNLIARVHFAGADQISADPNHFAFTNLFTSAEARALESQTLDKLSRAPGEWFKSKLPPGAGDGAAQLRPLLDDLLKSEWIFETRDLPRQPATEVLTPVSPEYALAIRLDPARAELWSKNLAALLQSWTGIGISQDKSGNWELKKHEPPNLFQFSRSGDWVVIDCGQDKLSLRQEILASFQNSKLPESNWLTGDLNWPRLAQLFPALAGFDFPKIQMQAVGRGGNLQLTGKLTLAQPLPPLEKWRVPTGAIHQPLVSFTAARGVGPWLAKQGWMRPLEIQPQPDQFFVWALAQIPFQTYAAEPVPDAKAALAQLDQRLSAAAKSEGNFFTSFTRTNENDEISWRGLPFIMPFVKAVREPAGDFLVGGFFPNPPKGPPPLELLAPLNQPNLVYYHWEVTAERLKELPQLSQLLLVLTRHEQVNAESAAGKWLNRIEPALGNAVTEVTQTAPNELAFKRTAGGGLTAIELLAFVDWLEAPKFPALDLRLPPPRVRPGQKPFNLLSTPVVPAPHP
jgi:hypothetical protein